MNTYVEGKSKDLPSRYRRMSSERSEKPDGVVLHIDGVTSHASAPVFHRRSGCFGAPPKRNTGVTSQAESLIVWTSTETGSSSSDSSLDDILVKKHKKFLRRKASEFSRFPKVLRRSELQRKYGGNLFSASAAGKSGSFGFSVQTDRPWFFCEWLDTVNSRNSDVRSQKTVKRCFSAHQHVAWVPVLPVDRSHAKHSALSRGGGYRITSLVSMHYLTAALKSLEPRIDDDFIDRLNYYYTSSVVIMFAILVSAKQYVGHPIECWVPAQFTKAMEQYTENYCWVQNTYWVPFGDLIPSRIEDRERRQIGYYQWVPFILAIEALMFYIPATVWRLFNTQSGINVHGILQMACNEHNIEPENRARTVHILARHIDDALRYQRDFGNKNKSVYLWAFIRLGKYYGAYVTLLYCFAKFLYLTNVLGQFFLLNRFLETADYPFFGAHVLWDLLKGQEWKDSGKFPRVTLCDFEIRVLGNIHRHTVQCVLVINMFTEKIFVFLWLWFLFLTICTFANLVFWITTLITPSLRLRFVLKYLELSDAPPDPEKDKKLLRRFVVNFLRPDGIFILRMVSAHAGTIMCTELAYSLWLRFKEAHRPPRIQEEALREPSGSISPGRIAPIEKPGEGDLMETVLGKDLKIKPEELSSLAKEPDKKEPWGKGPLILGNSKPWTKAPKVPVRPRTGSAVPPVIPVPNVDEFGTAHYV